ncbi:MAG: hypothetical protein ACPG80_01475, partial [Rickettsiales bacterium]
VENIVRTHAFLERALGPIDQHKYKAVQAEQEAETKAQQVAQEEQAQSWAETVAGEAANTNEHPRIKRDANSTTQQR